MNPVNDGSGLLPLKVVSMASRGIPLRWMVGRFYFGRFFHHEQSRLRGVCVQAVRIFEGFLLFGRKAAFHLLHIFDRRQGFGTDAAFEQGAAHGIIVRNVLARDGALTGEGILPGVENGDLGGKIFGLENDGRSEVGERAVVRHFPLCFHGLGGFAKQGLIALATDESEVVVAAGLFVDDLRKFLFGFA